MDNDFDDNDYFLKLLAYYFIYQCLCHHYYSFLILITASHCKPDVACMNKYLII